MVASALVYGSFPSKALNKEVDWDTDTIKVALLASTYTPAQDTHDYFSDVVANEVTGTGYTAGGQALANKVNTYTAGTNTLKLSADDTVWATSEITARYAVVYDSSPATDATRPLICVVDFGEDKTSSGGNFTVAWDAAGIVTVVVS